jgi:hypothetical protein
MASPEQLVVKALEEALARVRVREGITDEQRTAMQLFAEDLCLFRTDPTEFLLRQLRKLTCEQREVILAEFCNRCGGEHPCGCWLHM